MAEPVTFAQMLNRRHRMNALGPKMMLGADGESYGAVSTYGWDSVFTLRLPQVNEEIRKQKTSPDGFDQTVDSAYRVRGKFTPWSIGTTGDGELIHLQMGLRDVDIYQGEKVTTLASAIASVQVRLRFVPTSPDLLMAGETIEYKLVIETKPDVPLMLTAGFSSPQKAAQLLPIQYQAGHELRGIEDAILRACLEEWLNENLNEFAHVFATVNIANRIGDKAFDWLKPSETKYAFMGGETEHDCELAILCVSGDRDIDQLYATVAPGALPTEADAAAFVISGERFLDDMMRRALPSAYPGLKASDAVLSENKKELTVDKRIRVKQVDHDGKSYDIDLLFLSVVIDGNLVTVTSYTEALVSPGVHSECSSSCAYRLTLVKNAKGEDTLAYEQVGKPQEHQSTRYDKGVEIFKWIIIAVGAIAAIALVILSAGTAAWWEYALIALVFGLLQYSPEIAAQIGKGSAPGISLLAANATSAFRWAGGKVFQLTNLTFNGSLILGGRLA